MCIIGKLYVEYDFFAEKLHSGLYWILHVHESSNFASFNAGEPSTIKRGLHFIA
jgi:hypothetical protein